jgi:hypothetical protein
MWAGPSVLVAILAAAGCVAGRAPADDGYLPRPLAGEVADLFSMMETLPTKGEFYTSAAAATAEPFLPTFLALTEADVGDRDMFPIVALMLALSGRTENRRYVIDRFERIRPSKLKLSWGALLHNLAITVDDAGPPAENIKRYLQERLRDPADAEELSTMFGWGWDDFRDSLK